MSIFRVQKKANECETKQRRLVADVVFLLIPKIIRTLINVAVESSISSESLRAVK